MKLDKEAAERMIRHSLGIMVKSSDSKKNPINVKMSALQLMQAIVSTNGDLNRLQHVATLHELCDMADDEEREQLLHQMQEKSLNLGSLYENLPPMLPVELTWAEVNQEALRIHELKAENKRLENAMPLEGEYLEISHEELSNLQDQLSIVEKRVKVILDKKSAIELLYLPRISMGAEPSVGYPVIAASTSIEPTHLEEQDLITLARAQQALNTAVAEQELQGQVNAEEWEDDMIHSIHQILIQNLVKDKLESMPVFRRLKNREDLRFNPPSLLLYQQELDAQSDS